MGHAEDRAFGSLAGRVRPQAWERHWFQRRLASQLKANAHHFADRLRLEVQGALRVLQLLVELRELLAQIALHPKQLAGGFGVALGMFGVQLLAAAQHRVRSLYRAAIRSVPKIVQGYELEESAADVRDVVRRKFRLGHQVMDQTTLDALAWKGEMELEETLQFWKTKAHVQKYVLEAKILMILRGCARAIFCNQRFDATRLTDADKEKKNVIF